MPVDNERMKNIYFDISTYLHFIGFLKYLLVATGCFNVINWFQMLEV